MASRFEEDFLRGYVLYTNHFDKWCEKAFHLLGSVYQCGFLELDNTGHAFIGANKIEIGEDAIQNHVWKFHDVWRFYEDFEETEFEIDAHNFYKGVDGFKSNLSLYWFTYRVKIDDSRQRIFFFVADNQKIHNAVLNNKGVVRKLLQFFNTDSINILNKCQDHKFKMSDQKQDYFAQKNYHIFSNLNKVNNLFDDLNILKPNVQLTQRELECLKWIRFNKSAKEIASLLGISHRTVEIHIRNIKDKINIDLKDMFNYGEILT